MAIQLLKLRGVPPDELEELYALLDANDIDYYETSAGNWGISMPALWLRDESQHEQACGLLKSFHEQRYRQARSEYEELRRSGRARTLVDIIRENPARYFLYTALVIGLIYLSIAPYMAMGKG